MKTEQKFNEECIRILSKHKDILQKVTKISDVNKKLTLDEFPVFNTQFEKLQKDIAENLIAYLKKNQEIDLQPKLQPIAQYYIVSFLELVELPKL